MNVISIDFGTSNTQMACLDTKGNTKNIGEIIPTVLFVDRVNRKVCMGEEALVRYETAVDAANDADARYLEGFKPELCERRVGADELTTLIGLNDKPMTWLEVLTACFAYLREYAQENEFAGEEVKGVRLTHPVNFPNTELYRQAAEAAGFTEISFIMEPEAAYLGYNDGGQELGSNVLVFDMGGGTLDVALLQKAADGWRIPHAPLRLDTAGVHIDMAVCASLYEELQQAGIVNGQDDGEVVQFKRYARINIKEELGKGLRESVRVNYTSDRTDARLRCVYGRERFEAVLERVMHKVYEQIRRYVTNLPVTPDVLLMVGGSSRLKTIQTKLRELFPELKIFSPADGGSLVAKGALLAPSSPAGHSLYLATGSRDKTARITEISTGREALCVQHTNWVRSVAYSPCGRYLATGSDDKTARITEISTGKEVLRVQHEHWVCSVAYSPCGRYLATGSGDHTARITEISTGKEVLRVRHENEVLSVAYSTYVRYLATFRAQQQMLQASVAYSPCGRYLATNDGNTARITEISTGREVLCGRHAVWVSSVAYSPCGRYLATGSGDHTARITEISTGKEMLCVRHEMTVFSVAYSPCGRYLATGSSDNTARVTEIGTGREVLRGRHESTVLSVAYSPCGRYLATGSADETARITEISTGKEVLCVRHEESVYSVAFSPAK